jgi:murein L,D-transpeptidase YcbB/YkuD
VRAPENAEVRQTFGRVDVRPLVAQNLRLWGVADGLSEQAMRAWPAARDGRPDIEAVAARYKLSATRLQAANLRGLRAVGLPALVELSDRVTRYPYLLRRLDRETATLVGPEGEEARVSLDVLEAGWTHAAWILWRNPDQLPAHPEGTLSPSEAAAVGARLSKLGYLPPSSPAANTALLRQAVRRFQRAVGLDDDGVVGPITTLALVRASGGSSIVEAPATRP